MTIAPAGRRHRGTTSFAMLLLRARPLVCSAVRLQHEGWQHRQDLGEPVSLFR